MIAIPSVRGTGPTGWSCSFKDRDVVVNAIPKASRRLDAPPFRGSASGRPPSLLGTRLVTMTGRGAFDARPAQGRAGLTHRHVDHHSHQHLLFLARASAWSDPARSRWEFALLAWLLPGDPIPSRRLARTTMEPLPRAHRDRHAGASHDGLRFESSCGKGVRAA